MHAIHPAGDSHNVVACLGGGKTALERRKVPVPDRGELLLKLRVVGFCGTDLFKLDTDSIAKGAVLGHEVIGEIIGMGDGVSKFGLGDRIAVPHHVPCGACLLCERGNETMCEVFRENLMDPGGFADMILIGRRAVERAAHRLPDRLADEKAVFLEPAACVLRGVRRSGLADQGVAAVTGGGSMGLLHLLVLKAAKPAVKVVVVDPMEHRRAIAGALGADATAEPGKDANDAVHALSQGLGADAVFDTVGGSATLSAGLELTREGGTVILFAHAPEGADAGFDLNMVFKFERRVIGSYSGAVNEQREILRLIESGALDPSPLVTHKMPLDEFSRGVALVKNHEALKVLFTPSLGSVAQ